jgi:murein DD-endopeptidase MepM/ murein hydrolase activator NlpD
LPQGSARKGNPTGVGCIGMEQLVNRRRLSGPQLGTRVVQSINRHRQALATAIVTVLSGFAITAFGIAPIAPDAAKLPRTTVAQPFEPPGLPAQLLALAAQNIVLSRTELTRASDSADTLLRRLGIFDPALATFMRANNDTRRLFEGKPGKQVQARVDADGAAYELVARFAPGTVSLQQTHFTRVTIERSSGAWRAHAELVPLQAQVRVGGGTIRTTLFAATDESSLSDSIAVQLVELFSGDIDFHRQLRRGDTFSLVYEALMADDQPITWGDGTGRILAAEFVNAGKVHQVLWYADAGGKGEYFGPDGQSRRRSFLASPMAFSRITSGFAVRLHPIMRDWRAHRGVDYAAPHGTPVRTVGDGVVEFVGWQNGYGNVVQIEHGNDKSTLYAHLSQVDVRRGQRVEQGQRIGAVGATGWATGPHLHFEFRVGGQHQDPTKVAKSAESVLVTAAARPRFENIMRAYQRQLEVADTLRDAPGLGE